MVSKQMNASFEDAHAATMAADPAKADPCYDPYDFAIGERPIPAVETPPRTGAALLQRSDEILCFEPLFGCIPGGR